MQLTYEQVKKHMEERNYSLTMHSADKTWYSFMHERYPINCQVYLETGEFKLTHIHGIVECTTGKCGSFENDVHFLRIQRNMIDVVLKLNQN